MKNLTGCLSESTGEYLTGRLTEVLAKDPTGSLTDGIDEKRSDGTFNGQYWRKIRRDV